MDKTTATLIGLGILALVVIAFFAVFRGRGKFRIKTPLGEATAEGENPPLPTVVPAGMKLTAVEAGRDLSADNAGSGGLDAEGIKAKRDIKFTSSPGSSPPKP